MTRLGASMAGGAVAITINTTLLSLSDALGLRTARGGLLRLLLDAGGWLLPGTWWRAVVVTAASTATFQTGFHLAVGLAMAVVYGLLLRPVWAGRAWAAGLLYALVVWLLNAAVVLPLIGEGFAGSRNLTLAGMTGFAAIHTVFFVLLAVLFETFLPRSRAFPLWYDRRDGREPQ